MNQEVQGFMVTSVSKKKSEEFAVNLRHRYFLVFKFSVVTRRQ